MRVLVVEDDAAIGSVVAALLSDEGHIVVAVPTQVDGLAVAAGGGFDVCYCDGFGRDHPELTDADRALLARLDALVPTVLCTAHLWGRRLAAADLGVAAIVPKPFDAGDLIGALTRAAARPGRA